MGRLHGWYLTLAARRTQRISAYLQTGSMLVSVSNTKSSQKKVKQELPDDCLGLPGFSFAIPVVHSGPDEAQCYKLSHPDRGLYNKRPL
jgi:hypothetical protein